MKNPHTVLRKTHEIITVASSNQHSIAQQITNTPIYLKNGFLKHQSYIEQRQKNIEKLDSLKSHMEKTDKICQKA